MMASDTVTANIQQWRAKAREGTLTKEEMKLAIAAMRGERVGAGAVSTASKAKKASTAAKKQPVDTDALLGELGL
jgi:lipopolysaccharide export system protein LptC